MKKPGGRFKDGNRTAERLAAIAATIVFQLPSTAFAADPAKVNMERPLHGPWVPPESRPLDAAVPTEGAALQAQVERKLQEHFNAADSKRSGTLTREQAQAAGLGFVVKNFDQIDQRKTGAVRFDDVKHFLRERGAKLN